jgi:hypothetical protein
MLAVVALEHCSQCDLKENLWLCLICGSLGCGRQQYGAAGGNGHGLQHFQDTGHGVSVKLGTITPEGEAGEFRTSVSVLHSNNQRQMCIAIFAMSQDSTQSSQFICPHLGST